MPVQKQYTAAEVKSAIERANNHFYRTFLRVRNDVTGAEFGSATIKVERDRSGNPKNPYAWRGRGRDVGHTFRHVDGSAPAGKSIYRDGATAVAVTLELLNSATGQTKLAELDRANPGGDERGMDKNKKIVAPVTGHHYGARDAGQPLQKITKAVCEVMKLGESTLWIHTTYPSSF
jgi:hypothetical protein